MFSFKPRTATICSVFAVLLVLVSTVVGDDTEALRSTLKSLCAINKEGVFAQCCKDSPAASVVIKDKKTWDCYMNDVQTKESSITFLDFASKGLTDLGVGAFSSLKNLVSLEVGHSNISTVKKGAFTGLSNLLSLDLMLNHLKTLESGAFDGLDNLWLVHLFTNSLKALPPGIFDKLTKLAVLDFDYNSITSIPDGLFDHLPLLQAMDISANPLKKLPPRAFASLTQLSLILTHDNDYTEFPDDLFPENSPLAWLDLHSNSLTSLPVTTFQRLTKLQVLSLNSNGLTEIPADLFANNLALTDLDLGDNHLTVVPDDVFADLTALKYLNLAMNSLTYIDMGNLTPASFHLSNNFLVGYGQVPDVMDGYDGEFAIDLDSNCIAPAQVPMSGGMYVHIIAYDEKHCPKNVCSEDLRVSGCFECDANICKNCLAGYILYNGTCVPCDATDDCPFANKNEIYCVDSKDLSHCQTSGAVACADHVCVDDVCLHGNISDKKQCEIGGIGCKGCRCMYGWYPNKAKDCVSKCGDGIVVDSEDCDKTFGCNNETCKCADGFTLVQHGPRKKCVAKPHHSSSSSSSGKSSSSHKHSESSSLESESKNGGLSLGAIIGICIGGLIALAAIIVLIFFLVRRISRRNSGYEEIAH